MIVRSESPLDSTIIKNNLLQKHLGALKFVDYRHSLTATAALPMATDHMILCIRCGLNLLKYILFSRDGQEGGHDVVATISVHSKGKNHRC